MLSKSNCLTCVMHLPGNLHTWSHFSFMNIYIHIYIHIYLHITIHSYTCIYSPNRWKGKKNPHENIFKSAPEPGVSKTMVKDFDQGRIPPNLYHETYIYTHIHTYIFCFLGPHLQHMKVPRLEANQSCSCWSMPQPQQRRIQATSATYTTVHSNTWSITL